LRKFTKDERLPHIPLNILKLNKFLYDLEFLLFCRSVSEFKNNEELTIDSCPAVAKVDEDKDGLKFLILFSSSEIALFEVIFFFNIG